MMPLMWWKCVVWLMAELGGRSRLSTRGASRPPSAWLFREGLYTYLKDSSSALDSAPTPTPRGPRGPSDGEPNDDDSSEPGAR